MPLQMSVGLQNAANALTIVLLGVGGCDDPKLPAAAMAFQEAWNAEQTTQVPLSSQYDGATAAVLKTAMAQIGGSIPPGPCALVPAPGASPAVAPGGSPLTIPTTTLATPAAPVNWGPVVIVGALAVGVGLVAWAAMSRTSHAPAFAEEHRAPGKRRRRG